MARVRIVTLVVLASLGAPMWTFLRTASVLRASTWHTARDWNDSDGTAHTGSIGTCVHFRADWTASSLSPWTAVPAVSPMSWQHMSNLSL